MAEGLRVTAIAMEEIQSWLGARPKTLTVRDVSSEHEYQRIDVDLLVTTPTGEFKLEIKGDRWDGTGNFFFETVSNREKGTPGCFLYTQADFLLYYFVKSRELYILPMRAARHWFAIHEQRFPERATTTPLANGRHYTTVGRLVPIKQAAQEIAGVAFFQL